jgi:Mg2+-importing ATPase
MIIRPALSEPGDFCWRAADVVWVRSHLSTRRIGKSPGFLRLPFGSVVEPPDDRLDRAVALAVGLTPELLPMIVTVTLARSAMQMAKRKVIVKRLSAIHDLGAMNVLCTDKTGTLTEAKIKLLRTIDGHGAESANAFSYAYVNSKFETGMKSPLDEAILTARPFDMTDFKKIDEAPFDFERRRVSVLVEHGTKRGLFVKGAPEDLLRLSKQYQDADGVMKQLDPALGGAFTAAVRAGSSLP